MPSPSYIEQLKKLDRHIEQVSKERKSLSPEKSQATLFISMEKEITTHLPSHILQIFMDGMEHFIISITQHFPENIFWDFDFFVSSIVKKAIHQKSMRALHDVERSLSICSQLQSIYGIHSTIRFRYAHDFLYGFDWAKWVRKNPEQRKGIGPFDLPFLEFLLQRGHELKELIEQNDPKYHRLKKGMLRNPFGFSREPKDEATLLEILAAQQSIPVQTWLWNEKPNADMDFQTIRKQKALELGL